MNWSDAAAGLAEAATNRHSRWRGPVATTPRHEFIPRWWERGPEGWELHDGQSDPEAWQRAAYRDASLVTRVGQWHADRADPGDRPKGRPTSSATLPSLVVQMFQHARIDDDDHVLDVGTGSGYGAALAARRLGNEQVTSVDVDHYLVAAARERLAHAGLNPTVKALDATGDLPFDPDSFDRIVATVAVRKVPASWLTALCSGGRLVTTLAGTSLLVTAEKDPDGGATGRVEWDRAGFMHARSHSDYPPGAENVRTIAKSSDGDEVCVGQYPVVDVANAWDLSSMLELTAPGIEHEYWEHGEERGAIMAHPDGSWVRATSVGDSWPTIHQGGPRRLWHLLDACRSHWLTHGELPVRGAQVFIKPDGTTIIARGDWHVKLS
ncbi:methyltransferase domain-containing protein [Streptomyces sp. bgisy100]|uniref:methyltransferase domain-containing protein n=1 Tax=Streptomyces sp. bgisy100 TaxID=3413783 RepID=UPI003D74BE2F